MRVAPILLAAVALIGGSAATRPPVSHDGLSYARLKQQVNVAGPKVTPLAVIEDSRCPQLVTCVWAGRVRINARLITARGSQTREITLGQPVHVADGSLELVKVTPLATASKPVKPDDYRFGFRFRGGL